MHAAIAPPRVAPRGSALVNRPTARDPVLMAVSHRGLDRYAAEYAVARPTASSLSCTNAEVAGHVFRKAIDLIFLDVEGSLMASFVLAAHIRAAARRRDACGTVAIVATTSSECKFQDCLVIGSAFDGALKMPCDRRRFADCVDRWCVAAAGQPGS
jgi:hypothetical protein